MTAGADRAADFAVIIPHYNDVARLRRCLAALVPQAGPETEIVVVDNGSTEDIAGLTAGYRGLRLIAEAQRGAAMSRNAGAAATTARYLLFLDADCLPDADWLAHARAAARPDLIIGGRVRLFDETPPPRSGAEAFEHVFAFNQQDYIRAKGFSVTANLIVPRAVFAAVGDFRGGLSEDLDWCHRATAAGHRLVYDPALAVGHPTRSDWPALRRKWRRLTRETFELYPPGAAARAAWAGRALAMPVSILTHLPRIWRHRGLNTGEKARAAATLARLRLARMVWMLGQALTGRAGRG